MSRTGEGFKGNKKGKKTEISVSSLEVDPERTLACAKRLGNSGKIYSKLNCPLICSLDI